MMGFFSNGELTILLRNGYTPLVGAGCVQVVDLWWYVLDGLLREI